MKTIIGKELSRGFNNGEMEMKALLMQWYAEEDIHHMQTTQRSSERAPMDIGKVYLIGGMRDIIIPKPNVRQKVVIRHPSNTRYYRQNRYNGIKRDAHSSPVIGFKFNFETRNGYLYEHQMYSAFYYTKYKTLCIAQYLEIPEVTSIVNHLQSLGLIELRPVEVVEHKPIEVTIGCDPEFELVWDSVPVRPTEAYSSYKAEIGVDGAGSQIELRPKPSADVGLVVLRLTEIMKRLKDPISTIGDAVPLGGHIHIGIGKSSVPTKDLLYLLDYFLGIPTIDLSGKARGHYKNQSAYECKDWGFEYRTPPSAIFSSPDFAYLSMLICQEVTRRYVNKEEFVINETRPTKQEYINYCGFTAEQYHRWLKLIDNYQHNILAHTALSYGVNMASLWSNEISPSVAHEGKYKSDRILGAARTWPTTLNNQQLKHNLIDDNAIKQQRVNEQANDIINQYFDSLHRNRPRSNSGSSVIGDMHNILHSDYNITLNDDWHDDNVRTVFEYITDSMENLRFNELVVLFGLRADRGNVVSGFTSQYAETIVHETYNSPHWYGIPASCRREREPDMLREMLDTIINLEVENISTTIGEEEND